MDCGDEPARRSPWASSTRSSIARIRSSTYYQEFLHRAARPGLGRLGQRAAGRASPRRRWPRAILDSPEYQSAHQDPALFVHDLYLDVLGRQGESAGVAGWKAALASGVSRQAVVADFVESNEAIDQIVDSFYAAFLHRQPEPGQLGPLGERCLEAPEGIGHRRGRGHPRPAPSSIRTRRPRRSEAGEVGGGRGKRGEVAAPSGRPTLLLEATRVVALPSPTPAGPAPHDNRSTPNPARPGLPAGPGPDPPNRAGPRPRRRRRSTIEAPSVGRTLTYNIILPAGYDDLGRQALPGPLPPPRLLGQLHRLGQASGRRQAAQGARPDRRHARRRQLVVPNWAESDEGQKNAWEDYIVKDLIGHVDATYRTVAAREGRAINGLSMGGYGGLMLGLRHPDLFCSIGSHPAPWPSPGGRRAAPVGPGAGRRGRTSPPTTPTPTIGIEGFRSPGRADPQGQALRQARGGRRRRPVQARPGRPQGQAPAHLRRLRDRGRPASRAAATSPSS